MKRSVFFSVLLFIIIFSGASQVPDHQMYDSAVRPVRVSILFSRDLVPDSQIDLFRSLENEMNEELIDRYYPLSYGSGFFISGEGHLLTNFHVVDTNTVGINLCRIMNGFLGRVNEEYGYLFNKRQFSEFSETILNMFIEGNIGLHAVLPDEKEYELELLEYDEDRDLALLQLTGQGKTEALSFVKPGDIESVREVYSIGYPFPQLLKAYFEDTEPTITSGIISARREKSLDPSLYRSIRTLQHTSSINPGNSGGPLVTATGEVVGINSSLLTDANNIYFAVSTEEVTAWFGEIGRKDLLQYRRYMPRAAGEEGVHRLEVGFTSTPEGADVYVDNDFIGKTPVTTKLLGPREYDVRVSKEGYIDGTDYIYVVEEEALSYDFALQAGGEIRFEEDLPPTVRVLAEKGDDIREFACDEPVILPNGSWTLSFGGPISSGYSEEVNIESSDLGLSSEPFLKTLQLRFPNLLPESEISLSPSSDILQATGDLIELPYGAHELVVRTPLYRDNILAVFPDNTGNTFDISIDYQFTGSYLHKKKLTQGLSFLIPGAAVTAASVILNLDAVAVPLSGSYQAYSTLKYATFGSFIAGGISTAVGLLVSLKAGRYSRQPDDPLETEYDFSSGRGGASP